MIFLQLRKFRKKLRFHNFLRNRFGNDKKIEEHLVNGFLLNYLGRDGLLIVSLMSVNNVSEVSINKLLCTLFLEFLHSNDQHITPKSSSFRDMDYIDAKDLSKKTSLCVLKNFKLDRTWCGRKSKSKKSNIILKYKRKL